MIVPHRARGADGNNWLLFVLKTQLTKEKAITEASAPRMLCLMAPHDILAIKLGVIFD